MANTALAVCRGGCAWSVTVVDVTPGGVQASIAGAGTGAATIEACDAGGAERVSLDVAGETAAITCSGTGSMTATAVRASPTIELRAPASGPAVVINLATGDTATVGSPVTASSDNLEPILVELVDAADVPFGGFELDPGESVDVTFSPAGTGNLTVLVGTVTVGIGGGTATLGPGQSLAFLAADPGTALANLATQVGQLLASGAIRNAGIARSLSASLQNARAALLRGDRAAARGMLGALLNKLDAFVAGGQITAGARAALLSPLEVLLGSL